MAPATMHIVDFGAFQHPPSPLFRAHVAGDPRVLPFYGTTWDEPAVVAAGARTLQHDRPLADVVAALVRQQDERGAERAATRAAQIGEGATTIVTGQQPVLFGGPLFVLWKAIGAIAAARDVEKRTGRPVVPVFWVASDDHDFAEIRETTVLDAGGSLRTLRYVPRREPAGQPASAIPLDETIDDLLQHARDTLPAALARDAVLDVVAAAYRPGRSMSDAFARLLSALFPTLVVLDPSDPALKAAMRPVLAREILEGSPSTRWATADGQRLLDGGFHQQVPVRDGFLNLFVVWEGERRALGLAPGGIEVRGTRQVLTAAELARRLEEDPTPFSPGVLLRPLAQDHMLPTAAYVGGPAEIAYHAQIGSSYAGFGIPRPVLIPRPGVTLVEPSHRRALEAEGLLLTDLQSDPEGIVGRWARASHPEIEEAFGGLRAQVQASMGELGTRLAQKDPTLHGAADAATGRVLHQIQKLHEKSLRALKKKEQARAERLRRTRDALMPAGSLQERGLSVLNLLSRQGLPILETLAQTVDPWARGHQVLDPSGRGREPADEGNRVLSS